MPRDFEVYLEDIRQAIGKISTYIAHLSREQFAQDDKTVDAVILYLASPRSGRLKIAQHFSAGNPAVIKG
jgi:uncharacterized protein with HEPN domain